MFLSYSTTAIRQIRSIRVRIETSRGQAVYLCLSPCASTARGFYCFCLMTQIGVQEVQKVQLVQIRSIRPIRGRKEIQRTGRLSCYYQTPQLRQISLLSQEFWIVPQKRIGKSLLNEEKGIPLQPQTRKLHSETLTY